MEQLVMVRVIPRRFIIWAMAESFFFLFAKDIQITPFRVYLAIFGSSFSARIARLLNWFSRRSSTSATSAMYASATLYP